MCSRGAPNMLEFAFNHQINPRVRVFEFSIALKSTMYQFEPNPESNIIQFLTVDARVSDTPLLAVSKPAAIFELDNQN